jgi:hypothetical protein
MGSSTVKAGNRAKTLMSVAIGLLAPAFLVVLPACDTSRSSGDAGAVRREDLAAGTVYAEADSFAAPFVERLFLQPAEPGTEAIWGAIGRDDEGFVYFGTAIRKAAARRSAGLHRYDPAQRSFRQQGDAVGALKTADRYVSGAQQGKIHSKVFQADDGYLYFASMDEEGETDVILPRWGGHLWRKAPSSDEWQHLLQTREALIAVNVSGPYVYALGYWNHVLYQFDTRSEAVERVEVGALPGHTSRNFLVDDRGHAYVPRPGRRQNGVLDGQLCEFDTALDEVACHDLCGYVPEGVGAQKSQGIVAYTRMRNGDMPFLVGRGQLHVLKPSNPASNRPSSVTCLGNIHPEGPTSAASLFTFDGDSLLASVAPNPKIKGQYDWVVYETLSGVASATALSLDALDLRRAPLLYGSSTKDDTGAFYVVGRVGKTPGFDSEPVILRLYF